MLEVENLTLRYGAVEAVHGVSFALARGETLALIGSNGAGKSSVLRGILGVTASEGRIVLDGQRIDGLPTHRRVAAGVALSPEGRQVFAHMSVAENLDVGFGAGDALARASLAEEMFGLFPRLRERHRQRAGSLSGGEQQMLAIARALMSRPKLLMLDEPTLGLAPIIVDQLIDLIRSLSSRGLTILLAEQNAEMALEASDSACVLETGTLKRRGTSRMLAADPAIREDYLGL